MSTIPSNLDPAIHDFTIYKGDQKEFIYTFPYDVSSLTFEVVMFLKSDNSVEVLTDHHVDGTYDLYVVLDATAEDVHEGEYSYGIKHTGDGLPVTCVIGSASLVKGI